jgi:hypothetical protein
MDSNIPMRTIVKVLNPRQVRTALANEVLRLMDVPCGEIPVMVSFFQCTPQGHLRVEINGQVPKSWKEAR